MIVKMTCGSIAFAARRCSISCCTSTVDRPATGTRPANGTLTHPSAPDDLVGDRHVSRARRDACNRGRSEEPAACSFPDRDRNRVGDSYFRSRRPAILTEARSKAFGGLRQQRVDDGAIDIDDVIANPVVLKPLIDHFTGGRSGGRQVRTPRARHRLVGRAMDFINVRLGRPRKRLIPAST